MLMSFVNGVQWSSMMLFVGYGRQRVMQVKSKGVAVGI